MQNDQNGKLDNTATSVLQELDENRLQTNMHKLMDDFIIPKPKVKGEESDSFWCFVKVSKHIAPTCTGTRINQTDCGHQTQHLLIVSLPGCETTGR